MTDRLLRNRFQLLGLTAVMVWGTVSANGCSYHSIKNAAKAIPASRLDRSLLGEQKRGKVPILFSSLGQDRPDTYRVGPGDTLAIYVFGVLPPGVDETPVLSQYQTLNQRYYPPGGSIEKPTTGLPMTIGDDGTLELPLIGNVPVAGLNVQEVSDKIRRLYLDSSVIAAGRERITVNLITKNVHRVVVLRQDSPSGQASFTGPAVVNQIHRGSGEVIDLPNGENDVLHALAATGGLPGTDGVREIWVLRNAALKGLPGFSEQHLEQLLNEYGEGGSPNVVRIPLFVHPGEPLTFTQKDIVLKAGDTVYIPRRLEHFYTGGLLGGAKIPLPADQDVDIIEAIALATNSVGGPLGASGLGVMNGSPGYIITPSRAIVVRKLPDGTQISIRVDLDRAIDDKKERINILPDDLVMLYHKPMEGTVNAVLNFVGFGVSIPIVAD